MKLNFVLIASFFFCSMLSQIEIPLYKTSTAYEELSKPETTIDDIDKTHFLVDLNLGTPSKSYPLQVEMAKEDIFIVNENFKPKKNYLSKENSQSFISEKIEEGAYDSPAKDNLSLNDKNFELKFRSSEMILDEPLNKEASGILGLSLGDIEIEKKDKNRFSEQLVQNKIVKNTSFFFQFDEIKIQPSCKVPTLKEYLGIKGKIYIGDFPYNISPNQCDKLKIKTAKVLQTIKHDKTPLSDLSSLSIQFDMEKCIGCTACVRACSNIAGQGILACEKKVKLILLVVSYYLILIVYLVDNVL